LLLVDHLVDPFAGITEGGNQQRASMSILLKNLLYKVTGP
jgi:hypothetical protein